VSRWLYPFERRLAWESRRLWAIVAIIAYFVLELLDRTLFHALYVGRGLIKQEQLSEIEAARNAYEQGPGVMMVKNTGYLPVWIAIGAALGLARRAMDGVRLIAAAAVAGGAADLLKPLIGRVRPCFTGGRHMYRHAAGWDDAKISYGMASSHGAVAFGAAFMVLFLYGRAGWVAMVLAAGCGLERMAAGAHFATDVYVGAALGYASARFLRPGGWYGTRAGLLLP
jgi:membrane-associated phospholipid phosphatase